MNDFENSDSTWDILANCQELLDKKKFGRICC